MAEEKDKRTQSNQESNRIPDSRRDQNNRDINKGNAYGELNESKIPDFQFTPPPPKRNDDSSGNE